MKLFNKILPVAFGALMLTACSDDDDYTAGVWDANENYADVYFPVASGGSIELDPDAPTTVNVDVARRNHAGDLTVNFECVVNDSAVFEVGTATFADGDSVATVTVNFSKAELGIPYRLQFIVNDPALTSSYSTDVAYSLTITRVKWNAVGFYYDEDGNKVEGWSLYTDDVVGTLFGAPMVTYPVKVLERDDQPGMYRMVYPYGEAFPYNDPGDYDESMSYDLLLDATNPDEVTFEPTSLGLNWGYGVMSLECLAPGTLKDGVITFPVRGLAVYDDDGGYYANTSGGFKLVITPAE